MKAFLLPALLPLLALTSCDKARQAVEKIRQSAEKTAGEGREDAALAGLVERDAEGVRFRRDLPFPDTVTVNVREVTTYSNLRGVKRSALGTMNGTTEGSFEEVTRYERSGGGATITLERSGQVIEEKEEGEKGKPASQPEQGESAANRLVGKSLTLHHTSRGWRMPKSAGPADFQQIAWGRNTESSLPGLFEEEGLLPRTLWFPAARSWKEGDVLELSGASLGMLFPKASGKLSLVFEGEEAVEGHPCGRFSVKGGVSFDEKSPKDGMLYRVEMTISEGRVWCSLLHPVVIKEELDTVQSVRISASGGIEDRFQGKAQVLCVRTWKAG